MTNVLNLGSTTASQHLFVGSTSLGMAYGLTSRLTLFGVVPFRRVQARSTLGQDSTTANAGLNPADPTFGDGLGATQDATFFAQFDAALTSLQGKLSSGFYDGDPAAKQLADRRSRPGTASGPICSLCCSTRPPPLLKAAQNLLERARAAGK